MKFLMASLGETEVDTCVTEDYIDCCLGSPTVVIAFMKTLTEDWKLTSSGSLSYLKSMCDLLDFRKASGVSDAVLSSFVITEVYIRRGKMNLAKKKKVEYARNLDLETLIARDSWASISEMEKVIPYHIDRYKAIVSRSTSADQRPTRNEFAFATRFIATFLFLRVKCSRPITFQYLTLDMISKARDNGGYVDQTEFKTRDKSKFDTVILDENVLKVIDIYVNNLRPMMNPICNYLLVSTNGTQYQPFTAAMSLLVKEAIGKYINPTRYRQIIETESSEKLDHHEQDILSKDQKHSSSVAKRFYKKKLSREVAIEGKRCMDKLIGDTRTQSTEQLAQILMDIDQNTLEFDHAVVDKTKDILRGTVSQPPTDDLFEGDAITKKTLPTTLLNQDRTYQSERDELSITRTVEREEIDSDAPESSLTDTLSAERLSKISDDVEVKREEAEQQLPVWGKSKRFTVEEDRFLKVGLEKYGKGNWSRILNDPSYRFHPARTRDSLRMRAETCAFKIRKTIT